MDRDRVQIPPLAEALFVPAFFAVAVISLVPSPGPIRVVGGLNTLISMWMYAYAHWVGGVSFVIGPMLGFAIGLRWVTLVAFGSPERDFRLVSTPGNNESPVELGVWRKLKWSAELWCAWRGVGWNFADPNVPRVDQQTCLRFLTAQVARAALSIGAQKLIVDHVFCFLWPQGGVSDLLALPVFLQYKLAVVHLVLSWLFIDCIYRVIAIMAVSLDLSSPERWPPCFGNAADLYSVRNFWGRVWHQMFRKNFQAAGCAAAHIIGAEKGSMLARYTKLYVGFAVSGLQHYMAARFVPSKAHGGALFWQMPCYAAVVTLEDALASAARSAGIQAGVYARGLGYLWTAFWVPFIYRYGLAYYNDVGSFVGSCPA